MTHLASLKDGPDLLAQLQKMWGQLLNRPEISLDDDFFELGGDSLLATEMLLYLERVIGKPVPSTILFEASTIRTLAELLMESTDAAPKVAVGVGAAGAGTPLLFFHGDWTMGGFFLKRLARSLGAEQPIIAIAPHGMNDEPIPESIEAMAADRLAAILEAQPRGPYRLGGHCVGGMVAFEAARLLMHAGHQVEFVVMIDPLWMVGSEPLKMVRTEEPRLIDNPELPQFPAWGEAPHWDEYSRVLETYVPRQLSAKVLVFSSEYDCRPWRGFAPDLELFDMPGGHFDWVTVRATAFAAILRSRIGGDKNEDQ